MDSTYACLEQFTYAGLETFTYAELETCVSQAVPVPTPQAIFTTCHARRLGFAAPARRVQVAPGRRSFVFEVSI